MYLVGDPGSTAFFLLETGICGVDSRNRIRERLSRTEDAGNHAVSPESLGASRLPSFVRTWLNNCHSEDRCFFLRYYLNPIEKNHISHGATVAVKAMFLDLHDLAEGELGRFFLSLSSKVLAGLWAVDAVKTNLDRRPVAEHRQSVTIGDAYDLA